MNFDNARSQQLHEAFSQHQVHRQAEGRWLLRKPNGTPDGDITLSVEIICGWHRELVVAGDISPVVFARSGSGTPAARVHWLGQRSHVDEYVFEKACIGMGGSGGISVYDSEAARAEVASWCIDYRAEGDDIVADALKLALADPFIWDEGPERLLDALRDCLDDDNGGVLDDRHEVGMIPTWSVYQAHAALHRLSALLDLNESWSPMQGQAAVTALLDKAADT